METYCKPHGGGNPIRIVTSYQESLILEFLEYDSKSGKIIWKKQRRRGHVGMEAGSLSQNGYRAISIDSRLMLAHRVAWFLFHGRWPDQQIDHINGDKLDNRLVNLREVRPHDNFIAFKKKKKSGTSRFRGVTREKEYGRWRAMITKHGKCYKLGSFIREEDAAHAYNVAAKELGFFDEALNKI